MASCQKLQIQIAWPEERVWYSREELNSLSVVTPDPRHPRHPHTRGWARGQDRDRDEFLYVFPRDKGPYLIDQQSFNLLERTVRSLDTKPSDCIYFVAHASPRDPTLFTLVLAPHVPLAYHTLQAKFKAKWLNVLSKHPSIYDLKSTYIQAFAAIVNESKGFPLIAHLKVAFVVYPEGGHGDIVLALKLVNYLKRFEFIAISVFVSAEYGDAARRFFTDIPVNVLPVTSRFDESLSRDTQAELKGYDLYFYLTLGQFYTIYLWFDQFNNENPGFFNVATVSEYNVNAQEIIDGGYHTDSLRTEVEKNKRPSLTDFYVQFSKLITFPLGIGDLTFVNPKSHEVYRRPYDGLIITPLATPPLPFSEPWPRCPAFGIPGKDFPFAMAYVDTKSEIRSGWKCVSNFVAGVTRNFYAKPPCCQGHRCRGPLQFIVPSPDDPSSLSVLFASLHEKLGSEFPFAFCKNEDDAFALQKDANFKVILNFQVLPLPFEDMQRCIYYSINDILVTGDQSISDVLSCCPSKTIYYQTNSWKTNFASQLGHVLHLPHLVPDKDDASSTCVPLGLDKTTKRPKDIRHLIDEWSFDKRAGLGVQGLLQGTILRAHHEPFRVALDKIAALVRGKIRNNEDTRDDQNQLQNMINECL